MNKDRFGFVVFEYLLILVVVCAIGGLGWYVWNSKSDSDSSDQSTQTTNSTLQAIPEADKPDDENDPQYLEIKEYGIKLELNSTISDAYYNKSTEGYLYFSTHYFDNIKGFEGCKANPDEKLGGLGLYALQTARLGEKDDFGDTWTAERLMNASQIEGTYYWLVPGNGGSCWDTTKFTDNSPEVKKFYEIRAAFADKQNSIRKL